MMLLGAVFSLRSGENANLMSPRNLKVAATTPQERPTRMAV